VKARTEFIEGMSSLDPTKLVFLDESGFATNLARRYGWAPRGMRPTLLVSKYGERLTVIGAIALDGVRAWTSIEKGMNGDDFIGYIRQHLNPTLRPGDVLVMDGPRVHRVAGVEEALAEAGATALYLPAYSPELNPIEMCWSVMKAWIRKAAPRALDRVRGSLEGAWERVTARLCASWMRHCGYAVSEAST
jgi:transposase